MPDKYLMIGEVLKPQGIRGEAKLKPYAADANDFRRWTTLYWKDASGAFVPVSAKCSRVHDGFAYVTIGDCASPEDVDKLRGRELYIDRDHASALEEDAVYICDLIGCEAVNEAGDAVGVVTDVLQHGAVDVYVFKTAKGVMMAPALKAAFPEVDIERKRMTVCQARLDEVAVLED